MAVPGAGAIAAAGPRRRRRRMAAGAWAVGTLAVVAAGWWTYDRTADTDSRRADPEVRADSLHLTRIAFRGCNAV
ncbi:MAG TPA: hypothetical protein VK507_17890 [Iamia sp.]|nr:hypothetical protein [Iamia sp.]